MSAFFSFEKSNVHWGFSRWKQLKHDKNAMVGFHFITENKSDTFKQTIRFSYMYAKLSLARRFLGEVVYLPDYLYLNTNLTTPRAY